MLFLNRVFYVVVGMKVTTFDEDDFVEVVVGQVEVGSLIDQKVKKSAKRFIYCDKLIVDIKVGSGSQVDIFVDMSLLESIHELNDLLKKMTPYLLIICNLLKDLFDSNL